MTRVIIIDDERLFCRGFQRMLDWGAEGFEIVGAAHTGPSGYELCSELRPDMVVTDIRIPGFDGLELTSRLKREMPDIQIIILSAFSDFEYARAAIRAGASEYLLKAEVEYEDILEVMKRLRTHSADAAESDDAASPLPLPEPTGAKGDAAACVVLTPDESACAQAVGAFCRENHLEEHSCCEAGRVAFLLWRGAYGQPLPALLAMLGKRLAHAQGSYAGVCAWDSRRTSEQALHAAEQAAGWARFYGVGGAFIHAESLARRLRPAARLLDMRRYMELATVGYWGELRDMLRQLLESLEEGKDCAPEELLTLCAWCLETLDAAMPDELEPRDAGIWRNSLAGCRDLAEFAHLFQALLEERFGRLAELQSRSQGLREVLEYIRDNLHRPITLGDAAAHVHTTPAYLSSLFRAKMGKGFNRYVNEEKIKLAKQLLLKTGQLVGEIACDLGFASESYFTRVFKKLEGIPPEAYREKHRLSNH